MIEEKRIYVVVAETVDTPKGVVIQPCGRIAAQCAHVVSRMHIKTHSLKMFNKLLNQGFTTIVLAAKNTEEITTLLKGQAGTMTAFYDTNSAVYGKGVRVLTAVCSQPLRMAKYKGQFDAFPLWSHDPEVRQFLPLQEVSLV